MKNGKIKKASNFGMWLILALFLAAGCSSKSNSNGSTPPALPVIHSLSIQGLPAHPGSTITATVNATSPASLALTYTWTVSSNWSINSGANQSTASITAPDTYSAAGTVTVIVSDTKGGSVTGTSSLSTEGNSSPVVNSISVSANPVFTDTTITATVSASDPDGDTLGYTWTATTGWTIAGYGATATVTAPSAHSAAGHITVTVSDGQGASANSSIAINTITDSAPVITSVIVSPQPVTTTADLTCTAYDPDGDSMLSYTWNIEGINITTGSNAAWQTPGISGNYSAVVSVSDSYGSTSTQGTSISVTSQSPWPKFRNNAQSTGLSAISATPTTGALEWSYTTESYVYSPVIAADGTIYVASDNGYATQGYLYAIHPNGGFDWSDQTYLWTNPCPLIGADGTVYLQYDGVFYALNPTGTTKWSLSISNWGSSAPAMGADGTIYMDFGDYSLYAISTTTNGSMVNWTYPIGNSGNLIFSTPAIGADGTIYVGSLNHYLYAINPNGGLTWSYPTNGEIDSSPAIGTDGTIYVGSYDGHLYAINPDGALKWSSTVSSTIYSSPAIGSNGTIYIGTWSGYLYALNPTNGTVIWNTSLGGPVEFSTPAIGADGTIYVGTEGGIFYAIYPDGTVKWSYPTGGAIESSPAIGSDGTVYVGSNDGHLYAIH